MQKQDFVNMYVEGGYFGLDESDVQGMPEFWLRKVISMEQGELFCRDGMEQADFRVEFGLDEYEEDYDEYEEFDPCEI